MAARRFQMPKEQLKMLADQIITPSRSMKMFRGICVRPPASCEAAPGRFEGDDPDQEELGDVDSGVVGILLRGGRFRTAFM